MVTTNIACPDCSTTNRIPTERLGDSAKCGKCKNRLFQGKPLELNSANVSATLSRNEVPVLVDCWAPWCGPCRNFAPVFEQAAREMEPHIRLAKLNTESEQGVAGQWQIRSIPTLIMFKSGKETARISGALSLPQLNRWVSENK